MKTRARAEVLNDRPVGRAFAKQASALADPAQAPPAPGSAPAVLSGWGGPEVLLNTGMGGGSVGPGRILVFSLDGSATLPEPGPPLPPIAEPTFELAVTSEEVEKGKRLFAEYCFSCHGIEAAGRGIITPDLRRTTAQVHGQKFHGETPLFLHLR